MNTPDTLTCLVKDVKVGAGITKSGYTYAWTTSVMGAKIYTPSEATTYVDRAGKYL